MLKEWLDAASNQLLPAGRKIFTYIGHDSTVLFFIYLKNKSIPK
jgi:hypothetical protein